MGYLDYANKICSDNDLNIETKKTLLKHYIWDIPQENNWELNEVRKTLFTMIKDLELPSKRTRESLYAVEIDETEKKENLILMDATTSEDSVQALSYNAITGEIYVTTYALEPFAEYIGINPKDFSDIKKINYIATMCSDKTDPQTGFPILVSQHNSDRMKAIYKFYTRLENSAREVFVDDNLDKETKKVLLQYCMWDIPQENNEEFKEARKILFSAIEHVDLPASPSAFMQTARLISSVMTDGPCFTPYTEDEKREIKIERNEVDPMSLENIKCPIKVLSYNKITGEVYVKTYDRESLAQYIGVDAEDFSDGKKINYVAQKCSEKADPQTRLRMLAPQYDQEKMRAIAKTNEELKRGKPCTEISDFSIASIINLKTPTMD